MIQGYRCPNCRSLIQLTGVLDFSAPAIQELYCPVCSQKWWVPSGFPGYRWSINKVIERFEPKTARIYVESPPEESQQSIWKDTRILQPLQEFGKSLYGMGMWLMAILVLIVIIGLLKR